jgi:hypothetical protein
MSMRIAALCSVKREAALAKGVRGLPLDMSRTCPECLDPENFDRSVAADVLVRREEPDAEEEEEEEEEDDKEDQEDEGYSE